MVAQREQQTNRWFRRKFQSGLYTSRLETEAGKDRQIVGYWGHPAYKGWLISCTQGCAALYV